MARVSEYDNYYAEHVTPFVSSCSAIKGGDKIVSLALSFLAWHFPVSIAMIAGSEMWFLMLFLPGPTCREGLQAPRRCHQGIPGVQEALRRRIAEVCDPDCASC